MNKTNELLLVNDKHTDTLIEQTKVKPQKTLEYKLNAGSAIAGSVSQACSTIKYMQTFSFSPPINVSEEEKWLLVVTVFAATNSLFNVTDENNSFSISSISHWIQKSDKKTIDKLNELLELRYQNYIELHVEGVGERVTGIEKTNSGYELAGFDVFEEKILAELS